jgi:hypothetical protein
MFLAIAVLFLSAQSQQSSHSTQKQASKLIGDLDDPELARQHLQEMINKLYGTDAPKTLKWVNKTQIQVMSKIGDVAEGIKIEEAEGDQELYLDTHPCNGEVIAFHHPYGKEDAHKTKKCGEKTFPILRVLQK